MPILKATTLAEFHLAFRPEPLTEPEDIARFYRDELNELRDANWRKKMALRLKRAKGAMYFRGSIAGHEGVGKTTEMAVLLNEVREDFKVVRQPQRFQRHLFAGLNILQHARFIRFTLREPASSGRKQKARRAGSTGMTCSNAKARRLIGVMTCRPSNG